MKKIDKVKRYNWVPLNKMGELCWVNKHDLFVEHSYQRNVDSSKAVNIARDFDWIAFGAILVSRREGGLHVMDGQHRLEAALRRDDISVVPCVVFETMAIEEEAKGFIEINTNRKPLPYFDKHRALVVAGDETAIFVQQVIEEFGGHLTSTSTKAGGIKCLKACYLAANESRQSFRTVIAIALELSIADDTFVNERLFGGLLYIHKNMTGGLNDKKLVDRLKQKGAKTLLEGASRACAFYAKGGANVWAEGILNEVNKGLHKRFTFDD